jgi:ATP-dependent Lhr-like helicase
VEEYFASTLSIGDTFYFAGMTLEVERIEGIDLTVKATTKPARIPTYVGARMAMTTNLADRVRAFLHDREQWPRFPDAVREWLEVQDRRSTLPAPTSYWSKPSRTSTATIWSPTASRAGTPISRSAC